MRALHRDPGAGDGELSGYLHELDAHDPLPFVIALALGALVAVGALRAPMPMAVTAPGMLRPALERLELRAPQAGKVARVHITIGARVAAGQPIVTFDAARTAALVRTATGRVDQAARDARELRTLTGASTEELAEARLVMHTAWGRSQLAAIATELRTLYGARVAAHTTLARADSLHRLRFASDSALEQARLRALATETDVEAAVGRHRVRWLDELRRLEAEGRLAREQVAQGDEDLARHVVRAPAGGVLQELAPLAAGSDVLAGDRLAIITPDTALHVEVLVPGRDIAAIRLGTPVRVHVDAYPYTEWGALDARVADVAPDHLATPTGPQYRVRCRIERAFAPRGADSARLRAGMGVVAIFKLGSRPVWRRLVGRVGEWLVPPAQPSEPHGGGNAP
ncbi:MAG: HlyD family secretion protein [Gemmatimonadaceae bacterium]|jgi:HlyD family secretion protein|nr:HlyD family secretion protein [Gemmatimonadaceae bacterium]